MVERVIEYPIIAHNPLVHTEDYTMPNTTLIDVSKEAGVHDLNLSVRRWFAKAILAERSGDNVNAAVYLQNALDAEATTKSA